MSVPGKSSVVEATQKMQDESLFGAVKYWNLQGVKSICTEKRLLLRRGRKLALRFHVGERLVDQLLKLFAWLEVRDLLRRHVDFLAGLGIASGARFPAAETEAAET